MGESSGGEPWQSLLKCSLPLHHQCHFIKCNKLNLIYLVFNLLITWNNTVHLKVCSRVSPRCPQLYCNHSLAESSEPEKDDHVASTVVGDLKFKGKADDPCLMKPRALQPALAGLRQATLYPTDASVGKENFL